MKRIISVFLAISIMISLLYTSPVYADSVDSAIQARIDELYNRIGNKYFTTDGTACNNGNSCSSTHDHCRNSKVVQSEYFKSIFGFNLSSSSLFPPSPRCTAEANSCSGFASFAEWYLFRSSNSSSVKINEGSKMSFEEPYVTNNAKIGDIISLSGYCYNSDGTPRYNSDGSRKKAGHEVIFISANSYGITVLDSNWGNGCKVTKHTIGYYYCDDFQIGRATTRGEVAPPDTEAPTISGLDVKDISGDSFTVECNLNDNVGVTRVWYVLYAPGGTYEFGDSASNGYYSKKLETKNYGGMGIYSLDLYAYDAVDNKVKEEKTEIVVIKPKQPTNVNSTKTVYQPGEEITFSWDKSEYATDYNIEIWNGNTVLYSKNIGNATSFTTPLADSGNCAICVSAGNSVGYSEFTTYSFVVTNNIPDKPNSIVSSKSVCNTGEEVTFSWDTVDLATDYWVSIYNGGTKVYNSSIGNVTSFTSPFAYEGTYAFCVNSGNSNGYSESAVYSFVVTNAPPTQPKQIYSDKTVLKPSEKIIFTWDSLNSATDYWVSIYNGSEKIYNASIGDVTSFETSFSDCGTYAFCVSSGNKNGYSLSTSYRFYVTDEIPASPSKIISSKSVYKPNEEVIFSWEPIDLATDYWVSIYSGSEKIYNANVGNITSFKTSFNNCGNYAFCVSSGNGNGYSTSTRINYVVTDSIVIDSKVTKSTNSYKIETILYNLEESCEVIVAAYKGGKFVTLTKVPYESEEINTTLSGDIDEIKVMVWNNLSELRPLCDAEVIPSSEFIIE